MRKILFILGMAGYGLATYSQVDFGNMDNCPEALSPIVLFM